MRPLRLTLEGFTCFRQRQDPLDLEGLDLFAISGPTGAGKSSLLDAMIFALFGKVPRLRQGLSELIALGSARAAVSLDFRLGDREYRVFRSLHRARSTSAQLEEWGDGMHRSLSEGVRETDRHVQELLGLDYDTFIRAVILPQGDFAAFLKSTASKQREILRKLLRLDTYEEMRALARRQGQALEARLAESDRRLREDYAEATPDTLKSTRQELEDLRQALANDERALETCRRDLEQLRRQRSLWQELEDREERRCQLELQRDGIEADARRLEASRRVTPLLPLLDQQVELGERSQRLAAAAAESQEAASLEQQHYRAAQEALQGAEGRADEIEDLRRRGQHLEQIQSLVAPRQKALHQIETLAAQHIAKWAKLQAAERQGDEATKRLSELRDTWTQARDDLEGLGYDAELDARLDAVREPAGRLRHLRLEALDLGEQVEVAQQSYESAESQRQDVKGRWERASADLAQTESAHDAARLALRQTEHDQRVGLLRQEVTLGSPCPVCEQEICQLPAASPELHRQLEMRQERCESLRRQEEEGRRDLASTERNLATAEASSRSLREVWQAAGSRAIAAAEEVGRRAADVQIAMGEDLPGDPRTTVEERVLAAVEMMAEARDRHRQLTDQAHRHHHRLVEVERQRDRLHDESVTLKEQMADFDQRLADTRQELEALQERFAEVGVDEDPHRLQQEVTRRLEKLRAELDEVSQEERRRAVELATAAQRSEQAQTLAQEAESRLEELSTKVGEKLLQAGFENSQVARRAFLDESQVRTLDAAQRQFEQQADGLQRRLGELRDEVGEAVVSAADLRTQEEELRRLETAERQQREALASLAVTLADLERRYQRRCELEEELGTVRRTHRDFQELQKELGGQRFQAFLLEKVFLDLVSGATSRLMELSQQRYELAYENATFVVVDHDNASQRRSADTLSGGETFLASLALALELCEQVQREAGAITLESLFIDEGFGTLDPETLETVASAIEALPHGGRMVGIITHLPELTERLPWRVMVEKHPTGSSYRIEEG